MAKVNITASALIDLISNEDTYRDVCGAIRDAKLEPSIERIILDAAKSKFESLQKAGKP